MRQRVTFASAMARRFLLVGLVPVLIVGIVSSLRIAATQRRAVEAANRLTAEAVRGRVEEFLETPAAWLTQLNHIDEVASIVPVEQSHLQATVDNVPFIESVELVNAEGEVMLAAVQSGAGASSRDLLGIDRSGNPQFQTAARGRTRSWSGVFTSSVTGRRALNLAVPVRAGIGLATVEIESLSRVVQLPSIGERTDAVILDSQGTVLFDSRPDVAELRPNWRNIQPVAAALGGRAGDFRYERDGAEILGSTSIIQGTGWVVLVEQPWSEVSRSVVGAWRETAVLAALVAIVAIMVGLAYARVLSRPIAEMEAVAARVAQGDYTAEPGSYRYRELENLGTSLSNMVGAVSAREKELATAVHDREAAIRRNRAISAELAATEERERRRLAEELHDRVSQALAVAGMRIGLAQRACGPSDDLEQARELLRIAIDESRAITSELASPALFILGLEAALRDTAEEIAEEHEIQVVVEADFDESELLDEVKSILLRSARELMMNVVKHAAATRISARIEQDDRTVILTVTDDGVGAQTFSAGAGAHGGGFGLESIRQRVKGLGGTVDIRSVPGEGTVASVRIPIHPFMDVHVERSGSGLSDRRLELGQQGIDPEAQ